MNPTDTPPIPDDFGVEWRLLQAGEAICAGDQYLSDGEWASVEGFVGVAFSMSTIFKPVRRSSGVRSIPTSGKSPTTAKIR